jgi:hypothetical protein
MPTLDTELLEMLGQCVKWWESAATTCERVATGEEIIENNEWLLMCAIYRERAKLQERMFKKLSAARRASAGGQ